MRTNISFKLLDQNGKLIRYISERQAHEMFNAGVADRPNPLKREIVARK